MFIRYTTNKSKRTNSEPLADLIFGKVQLSDSYMILFYVLACGERNAVFWDLFFVNTYSIHEGLALLTITLPQILSKEVTILTN